MGSSMIVWHMFSWEEPRRKLSSALISWKKRSLAKRVARRISPISWWLLPFPVLKHWRTFLKLTTVNCHVHICTVQTNIVSYCWLQSSIIPIKQRVNLASLFTTDYPSTNFESTINNHQYPSTIPNQQRINDSKSTVHIDTDWLIDSPESWVNHQHPSTILNHKPWISI